MTITGTRENPPELAQLIAEGPVALFLDFDGTLVEIAPTPDGIQVPDSLNNRLIELAQKIGGRLGLVSGRSIADLESHLGPIAVAVAGSHGADCRSARGDVIGARPDALSVPVVEALKAFCADVGLSYEEKSHGGAIHYRSAPSRGDDVLQFAARLAAQHDLDVKQGKCVVELVGCGASKAAAVAAFMDQPPFSGATPIFIGDDVTDEDGFRAAMEAGGFGIRVGQLDHSAARHCFANVDAVHDWLGL